MKKLVLALAVIASVSMPSRPPRLLRRPLRLLRRPLTVLLLLLTVLLLLLTAPLRLLKRLPRLPPSKQDFTTRESLKLFPVRVEQLFYFPVYREKETDDKQCWPDMKPGQHCL